MGAIGWLIVLSIVGFALLCFFRLGPVYLDDRMLIGMMKSVADNNPDLAEMGRSDVESALSRYSSVNGVRGPAASSFKVIRRDERIVVNSNYEVRIDLLGNIDVVLSFRHQLDSRDPENCCKYLIEDDE